MLPRDRGRLASLAAAVALGHPSRLGRLGCLLGLLLGFLGLLLDGQGPESAREETTAHIHAQTRATVRIGQTVSWMRAACALAT